jgi:hypothetical protein
MSRRNDFRTLQYSALPEQLCRICTNRPHNGTTGRRGQGSWCRLRSRGIEDAYTLANLARKVMLESRSARQEWPNLAFETAARRTTPIDITICALVEKECIQLGHSSLLSHRCLRALAATALSTNRLVEVKLSSRKIVTFSSPTTVITHLQKAR